MKTNLIRSVIVLLIIAASAVAGCKSAGSDVTSQAPYFIKGVYVNYAEEAENPPNDYYYIFDNEQAGHTDDGSVGIGVPFSCKQNDGNVEFSFGGEDGTIEVLTIDSVDNKTVKGHFDDGLKLVFEPVTDVDPETFDAQNYLNAAAGEDLIYNDANGWSVKYDPNLFTVNGGGPKVTFAYKGKSSGTSTITATYDVGKDAKTAIDDLAGKWGDKATTSEGIFPGTEDVTGYWAILPTEKENVGLYSTAIARDYMDGYLLFECAEYKSGDEETDMALSDALAGIIDSLEFTTYN